MKNIILAIYILIMLTACETTNSHQTEAAKKSGYTYIPIDSFYAGSFPGEGCPSPSDINIPNKSEYDNKLATYYKPLMDSLPDNAVRTLIEQFDSRGNISYGVASTSVKGSSYKVTVDYINTDTVNFKLYIAKYAGKKDGGKLIAIDLLNPLGEEFDTSTLTYKVSFEPFPEAERVENYNIPLYIGVGIRAIADITAIDAELNISGLGVIGAGAELGSLHGSLIIQTLGITGQKVKSAIPIQSELNQTTAQNAIISIATIKTLLHDDKTIKSPRVVGMYLPFPSDKKLVNLIISEISKGEHYQWRRPCKVASS